MNKLTEIVFIIDKSGSMSGLEDDTVGGFNSTVEKQRAEEGRAFVSTLLFDGSTSVLHDRVPIEKVEPLTRRDYCPSGCTALLDALGGAIKHIGNVHKYARAEDRPDKTIFVITTDGMENASHTYTHSEVKAMVERQTEKYGWEFVFLAANIDAAAAAEDIGIKRSRARSYTNDKMGVKENYAVMNEAISCVRNMRSLDDGEWMKPEKENK